MPESFYGKYVVEWTDPEFAKITKITNVVLESNVRSANPVEAAAALQVKLEGVNERHRRRRGAAG